MVRGAVTVAYVHEDEVAYSWHHSLIDLIAYDFGSAARLLRGGWISMRCGTDGLVQARNDAVRHFLDDKQAEWMFWVDTDMGFEPDIIDRLVAAADPIERPIVGALAYSYREMQSDGLGGFRCRPTPTIFDWVDHADGQSGFSIRWAYPPNTVIPVAATGSAAILIHRTALESVQEEYGTWYERIPNPTTGQLVSEDLSFCMRAAAVGFPTHVHTGVPTSHQKTIWLSEETYRGELAAPPATEQVAVIVPTLNRPQNAEPFMRSLRASTGLATVYAVVDTDDSESAEAWRVAGATVVKHSGSFAQKTNYAFNDDVVAPWMLLCGDDVRFKPGWLDFAEAAAGDRYDVVGTNDLGNPRVMAGDHATHILIRSTYIDEVGASWDGPGIVCHEGYRHWFVDDEIVAAAKQRDRWVMELRSVVEHLHPAWAKGPQDSTYELGQSFVDEDKATYEARSKEHS